MADKTAVAPLEEIKSRIEAAVPGAAVQLVQNEGACAQHSLRVDNAGALEVARFLRDDPALQFDYASNVSGVDWPDTLLKETVKKSVVEDGQEKEIEETVETTRPGCLEVVYHLYSVALGNGPLVLRLRTGNRRDQVMVPSLTPVWRGAEFQEREVYDLFGVVFEGHPDLRRILMWEEFTDHPMRKDYAEPDDYEYEPTPHADVVDKARRHQNTDTPA